MRLLLKECTSHDVLKFWIGDDLFPYTIQTPSCSILAIPYRINNQAVGAIGLLSSIRIPYKQLFALLHQFSDIVSQTLTHNLYKFQIQYRQPQEKPLNLKAETQLLKQTEPLLLEDMR
jgi:heat-inducible transcriptional repressor